MASEIEVRNKWLTVAENTNIQEMIDRIGWQWGWYSKTHDGKGTLPHWRITVMDGGNLPRDTDVLHLIKEPAITNLWSRILQEYGPHQLYRCYLNGYDHGDDGAIHVDAPESNAVTFLFYITKQYWQPDWGGETIVYDNNREKVIAGCLPQQYRMLKFPGCWSHRGSAPTKICPDLRVTLMFKAFKI